MTGTEASGTTPVTDDTPARVRNPWGQGDRLRGEILAAAGKLLGELGGVEGLTLRGVARAAGIAPASIYAHFADKNELVAALVEHEYERMLAVLREVDDRNPVRRVRAQLHAFCRYTMDNPGSYRLLFGRRPVRPDGGRTGGASLVDSIATALRDCEQAGARLRLPAERAAIVLIVGAHGRVGIQQARGDADLVDAVLGFADELLALVFEDPEDPESVVAADSFEDDPH